MGRSSAGWLEASHAAVFICRLNCDGRVQEGFIHVSDTSAEEMRTAGPSPRGVWFPGTSPQDLLCSRLSWASLQHGSWVPKRGTLRMRAPVYKRLSTCFTFVNVSVAKRKSHNQPQSQYGKGLHRGLSSGKYGH